MAAIAPAFAVLQSKVSRSSIRKAKTGTIEAQRPRRDEPDGTPGHRSPEEETVGIWDSDFAHAGGKKLRLPFGRIRNLELERSGLRMAFEGQQFAG